MIKVDAYQTSDEVLHTSYKDAKSHAEKRYGDQLTKMAHELVSIDKYLAMTEKLDGYKGSMQILLDLSFDMIVRESDND